MLTMKELNKSHLFTTRDNHPHTGPVMEETEDSKTFFSMENGRRHGPAIVFVKEGLFEIRHYKHGKKHGFCCTYDKNGRLATLENFYMGSPSGPRMDFKDGVVCLLRNMDNYAMRGIKSYFSTNGTISKHTLLENGKEKYVFKDPLLPILEEKEDD